MMLKIENTLVLAVDIQERLMPALHQADEFVAACRRMLTGAQLLALPILLTEQYPKGLGHTLTDIRLLCKDVPLFEKTRFSAFIPDVQKILSERQVDNVVVMGCETHICILQTVLDLLAAGYQVYLPLECLTSRTLVNKDNGLAQMQQAGACVSNIESILFQLLQDAQHGQFKEISKLIR